MTLSDAAFVRTIASAISSSVPLTSAILSALCAASNSSAIFISAFGEDFVAFHAAFAFPTPLAATYAKSVSPSAMTNSGSRNSAAEATANRFLYLGAMLWAVP